MNIFQLITLRIKLQHAQSHCVLGSINGWIDRFIIPLNGKVRHLILTDYGIFNKICDKIKTLSVKNIELKIVFIIILERSELIPIILDQLKKILTFHNFIILIKSVVNENRNK